MASPSSSSSSSSLFNRLVGAWTALQLRSDVDNIILELLGHFSLEKIYADGENGTYQRLVLTLLAQLNAIFYIQRMSLPSETQNVGGWYLGFLASWEVTVRSVEFVLQVVVEGREGLWEARPLRDKYLAEMLLAALRVLTLHPKAPKLKDRRDRFTRIHRSLEQVYDSYPGPESFLLLVCKEVTDRLRVEPNALALPSRYELPNLASELYPLADSLSPKYVRSIVQKDSYSSDWLSEFLTLRDISQFVVGASVQYSVNRETEAVRLRECSAVTRTAVLNVLEHIRLPQYLSKMDLLTTFSETFRIILPDTPIVARRSSSELQTDEYEIDAIDALCAKLNDRQVVQRVSDRELMRNMSEITRNLALLDDPSGQFRATRPRLYAINCRKCHIIGGSQLRYSGEIKFQDPGEATEINLPPQSKCIHCGEAVTMLREISIAGRTWDLLRPLKPNAETINVERHLPSQFQLLPSKLEGGMLFHAGYGNALGTGGQRSHDPDASLYHRRSSLLGSNSPERSCSVPRLFSPSHLPGFRQKLDTSRAGSSPREEDMGSLDTPSHIDPQRMTKVGRPLNNVIVSPLSPPTFSPGAIEGGRVSSQAAAVSPLSPFSPEFSITRKAVPSSRAEPPAEPTPFEPLPVSRTRTILAALPERGLPGWTSKLIGSKKDSHTTSGDSSSLSSTILESQKFEEISLKNLTSTKASIRGKSAKKIYVYLSENSTNALFWTQASIHLWDVGTSPPTPKQHIATESTCVLAAVTKVYLVYIIGTRDQKLTLRVVNLLQASTPVVEYRIPSSPWCTSLTISPKENYVVVGFDGSVVRLFSTTNSEPPREHRLHLKNHDECKLCPPVETLSFSNDGLMLLASTRHPSNGLVQVYSSRFLFLEFQEVLSCRYPVKLHESEDGGVTSVIFRSSSGDVENLICIATWTQSGTPILVQPGSSHKSYIRAETSRGSDKLGSRIQCAAFSPSGTELMMVNDKGYLYQICNLNSNPMSIKRIATSRELTGKSESYAMAFMTLQDEEAVVLAWADSSKSIGFIKKIPIAYHGKTSHIVQGVVHATTYPYELSSGTALHLRSELPADGEVLQKPSAELPTTVYL